MWRRIVWIGLLGVALAIFVMPRFLKGQIQEGFEEFFPGSKVVIGGISLGKDLGLDVYKPILTLTAPLKKSSAKAGGKKAFPVIKIVRVHGLVLNYRVNDTAIEIKGDVIYDLAAGRLTKIELTMPSFKKGELLIEGVSLNADEKGMGVLAASAISRQKIKLSGLKARTELDKNILTLSDVEASLAEGKVTGSARIFLATPIHYEADLRATLINLSALAKELDIEAKVGLGGRVNGRIKLSGDMAGLQQFSGDLSGTAKGGDVIIHDQVTLENLAKNMKQPIELVESSFKEYHFDMAKASLKLNGDDLGLKVNLEGVNGKRELEITLHDFL